MPHLYDADDLLRLLSARPALPAGVVCVTAEELTLVHGRPVTASHTASATCAIERFAIPHFLFYLRFSIYLEEFM